MSVFKSAVHGKAGITILSKWLTPSINFNQERLAEGMKTGRRSPREELTSKEYKKNNIKVAATSYKRWLKLKTLCLPYSPQ